MVSITKDHFSIRQICESGQCFRLERLDGGVYLSFCAASDPGISHRYPYKSGFEGLVSAGVSL